MSYEIEVHGERFKVVDAAALGCKNGEELRKLCSSAEPSKAGFWANLAPKDVPESPQNAS